MKSERACKVAYGIGLFGCLVGVYGGVALTVLDLGGWLFLALIPGLPLWWWGSIDEDGNEWPWVPADDDGM